MATTKDKNPESLFTIDSMVEVSREEDERFNKKRAWYVAKLLNKSLPNQKPKFLVKYMTLFFKNAPYKEPLTEEITGVSFIRPLPPPPAADHRYELYDVVDAFHRGGWWKGVVSKVEVFEQEKGESRKYRVVFENPPEKFDFCSEKLRFCSDWIDGKWVRSPKQKRMKGLNFGKGMAVEVNLNGEISQDAWFPAVVLEEVGFSSFLVEYSRSSKDGPIKETIDLFQIRPPPPEFEVKEFEILQRVEAFHDSCWKKGIIRKPLTGGWYSIILDSVKQKVFKHSEIRPRRIWMNGKWVGFKVTPSFPFVNPVQMMHTPDELTKSIAKEDYVADKNSSAGEDHSREKSRRKKMSDEIDDAYEKSSVKKLRKDPVAIRDDNNDAFGQQDNVSLGTASEMETGACASENAELPTEKDTDNGGDQDQSLAIFAQEDSELPMYQEMPFEKSSSFWQHLDALDVFRFLPQKPHFSPLSELNEATREGFAIAHTLNFANIVDMTSQSQVEAPREVLDSCLEALSDLEVFGFDVKPVIERINRLLSIKTRHEQLDNESKDTYSKIAECDSEKAKMEEEMNAVVKMIHELKERQAVKLSEKAKKDHEMKILQIDAHSMSEDISNLKLDFECQLAAPW